MAGRHGATFMLAGQELFTKSTRAKVLFSDQPTVSTGICKIRVSLSSSLTCVPRFDSQALGNMTHLICAPWQLHADRESSKLVQATFARLAQISHTSSSSIILSDSLCPLA